MKRFLLPLAAITIAGILLPSGIRPAYACSCALTSIETRVKDADIILTGTVAELVITPPLNPDVPDGEEHRTDVVLQVDQYLKGSGPNQVNIFEPGLTFQFDTDGNLVTGIVSCATFGQGSEGKRYILFLTGSVDSLTSPGLCSGSGIVDEEHLQEVQAVLAAPVDLPDTGGPAPASPSSAAPWLAIALASSLGAAALAAASTLLLRRR